MSPKPIKTCTRHAWVATLEGSCVYGQAVRLQRAVPCRISSQDPRAITIAQIPPARSAAGMAAASIVRQIQGATNFVASQSAILSPEALASSTHNLATSLRLQLGTLSGLGYEDASSINEAIAASAFSDPDKVDLTGVVASRVAASVAAAAGAFGEKPTQTMLCPANFLTASDWLVLESATTPPAHKIGIISDRLALLGCVHPSEASQRQIIALVAAMHNANASAEELWQYRSQLKQAMHARRRISGQSSINKYPDAASELPADIKGRAYASESPEPRMVEAAATIASRVPMRNTHQNARSQQVVGPCRMRAMLCEFRNICATHYCA